MIPIKNIYYMLSYAFKTLSEQGYKSIETESFNNAGDLCAEILIRSVSKQLKQGLNQEYITYSEPLSVLRGKVEISDSIKNQTHLKKQLVCSYDEFSYNNYLNQIIKTTLEMLLKFDISTERKKKIRRILLYFKDVKILDPKTINWKIHYTRNKKSYEFIISICYLIIKGLLQTQSDGSLKMLELFDEQNMHRLYENFVREYFKSEYPSISVSASKINWVLDDDVDNFLPQMLTDITLEKNNKILIIDTKYYTHTTQSRFKSHKLHSGNLYQIFTYVKNKEYSFKTPHNVSGMLLYAQTDEEVQPNETYHMSGNQISVQTLDLNQDFKNIRAQLDKIIKIHFEIESESEDKD